LGFQKAGFRELCRTHLLVILVGSCALLVFQYFLGGAAAPLREGRFSSRQLLLGLPLCFAWLTIEAGLVEEFFFRAFLKARLSAWFRSEITGVVLMALIFGLAHAPGFIFRHAGAVEGLGANPTALDAIAYSITTLAVSGVFRRHLGPNEKPFRVNADTRRRRSFPKSFRVREDLGFVELVR
jgi:membrane protease YdiL (CAAX protease family)